MVKKNTVTTVKDAREALTAVGKKLEKALGGEERGLALKAVRIADKCLAFVEGELDKFVNPETRENSLLATPADVSRAFKDAQEILKLFAGILKKTEEAERDMERDELHRRTLEAIEAVMMPIPMPLPIIDPGTDDSSDN